MRFFRHFHVFSVATLLASLSALNLSLPDYGPSIIPTAPKRRRTGVRYPHSSRRQQARYARQIAAGQLRMAGVEERI